MPRTEQAVSAMIGPAILYPMDKESFSKTISCLLSLYTNRDVALAGLTWDVTHALLRIMTVDPVQFFDVAGVQDARAVDRWILAFDHAALWPTETCPSPDPMKVARSSIESIPLQVQRSETLRRRVVVGLREHPCRTAS